MTFEEWYETANLTLIGSLSTMQTQLIEAAWEAGFEEGYKFANKENEDYDKIGV